MFMERLSLLSRLRDNLRALARNLRQRVAVVPRILVPSVVLMELDNFKDPSRARGTALCAAHNLAALARHVWVPGCSSWSWTTLWTPPGLEVGPHVLHTTLLHWRGKFDAQVGAHGAKQLQGPLQGSLHGPTCCIWPC